MECHLRSQSDSSDSGIIRYSDEQQSLEQLFNPSMCETTIPLRQRNLPPSFFDPTANRVVHNHQTSFHSRSISHFDHRTKSNNTHTRTHSVLAPMTSFLSTNNGSDSISSYTANSANSSPLCNNCYNSNYDSIYDSTYDNIFDITHDNSYNNNLSQSQQNLSPQVELVMYEEVNDKTSAVNFQHPPDSDLIITQLGSLEGDIVWDFKILSICKVEVCVILILQSTSCSSKYDTIWILCKSKIPLVSLMNKISL